MRSIRSFYFNFPNLVCNIINSQNRIKQSSIRRLCLSSYWRSSQDDSLEKDQQNEKPKSMAKYELFSEENAPVILDIEEERRKINEEPQILDYNEFEGINLKRGFSGVFEVEELVEILRNEKAEDIFVVKIPNEYQYADYMVVVSGKSTRHMLAMGEFVRRVFKKKMNEKDIIPALEGKSSEAWMALDLGNIILHVFSKKSRHIYDLESLWSLGKEYDSLYRQKESAIENIFENYSNLLAALTPAAKTN